MEELKALPPLGKVTKIFCIKDDKAESHGLLHLRDTESLALRDFADAINDPQGAFIKHPEDYRLVRVGEFNLVTGVITPESPVRIGVGSDFVQLKK